MRAFIESVRNYKNGRDFLSLHDAIDLLKLTEKYGIEVATSHIIGDEKNSVHLITVHKAK